MTIKLSKMPITSKRRFSELVQAPYTLQWLSMAINEIC